MKAHPEKSAQIVSELLGPFDMQLKRGQRAYDRYFSSGKKFLYTKILKETNGELRRLLLTKGHLLPKELRQKAIDLVEHLDVWHVLWDDLQERNRPGLDDEFVFENDVNFPKTSVDALVDFYHSLK
jgi:hypothetical protein